MNMKHSLDKGLPDWSKGPIWNWSSITKRFIESKIKGMDKYIAGKCKYWEIKERELDIR